MTTEWSLQVGNTGMHFSDECLYSHALVRSSHETLRKAGQGNCASRKLLKTEPSESMQTA